MVALVLNLFRAKTSECAAKAVSKVEVLCNQLLDSAIVGGIAGFSAYVAAGGDATLKVFALAFGLTFLVKLKDYRGIKE